jgi:PncC family amidohydrolase
MGIYAQNGYNTLYKISGKILMDDLVLETRVGELLRQQDLKLAVAESCTGGLIGHRITNVPGSSEYYLGSVTAYAYEAKERLLGVRHETLLQFGAVSQETVYEMARGIRQALAADFPLEQTVGVAVSGIAGPGGGMPGKPVGLVWMALSTPRGDWAYQTVFKGDRLEVKSQTAQSALMLLVDYLSGHVPPTR